VIALVLAVLGSGLVGGFVAGLLGVGGGIVIVPVLELALGLAGIDPRITMNLAVATSMATIIPTAISSSRSHARRGSVDGGIVKAWAVPIVLGAFLGSQLVARVEAHVLAAVFGVAALAVAAKMLLPLDEFVVAKDVPRTWTGAWLPAAIGCLASLMGVGGGTLGVPVMTLCSVPIHRAVGTAALLGLWIAVPATIGFLVARPVVETPWLTVGYTNLLGFALIAPVSVLMAPLGARVAHSMSRRRLSVAFGCFLLVVAGRMLYRGFL
jgi:uncharacterized membrane protein YfcA